jgi:hypothetical protein
MDAYISEAQIISCDELDELNTELIKPGHKTICSARVNLEINHKRNYSKFVSVSRKQYRGKAQGLRTREKRDSNTKVREQKARGRKNLHRLFFSSSQIFINILIG